jgi:hypothetical protein
MSLGLSSYSDGSGGAIQAQGIDILRVAQAGTVGEAFFLGGVSETVQGSFATTIGGSVTIPVDTGTVFLRATNASITSWNFTNVGTNNGRSTSISVFISSNVSYTYGDTCTVNGTAVSGGIKWSGGSAPAPSANTDILTFVLIKDSSGTVHVFGFGTLNLS